MMKKITYTFSFFFFLFLCGIINAQDLKVIDNKGTIKSINKVTYGTVVPTLINPVEKLKGDIYIKGTTALGSTTTPEETYLFDGTSWMKIGSMTHTATTGSIFFAGTDGTPTENNPHLFWDNVNDRLNIGNVLSGTNKLTVNGAIRSKAFNNANGTVGLPSYRFSSDGDTGMWRGSTANHLRFSTKGIEALTINALQNIGIGTDTPTEKLDVNGKLKVQDIIEETTLTTTDRISFVDATGVFKKITAENLGNGAFWTLKGNSVTDPAINFLGTTDAKNLVLKTNNKERILISSNGGVLINNQKELAGGLNGKTPLTIKTNDGTFTDVLDYKKTWAGNNYSYKWRFKQGNLFLQSNSYNNKARISFKHDNGYVGINTLLPLNQLHVEGDVRITDLPVGAAADKIVVADANGVLKTYNGPQIIATGNVNENGSCECSAGVNTQYTVAGEYYYIDSFGTGKYTIQLTLEAPGTGQWNRQIYYYDKSNTNFKVKMTDRLQGYGGSDKRKKGAFSFVITRIP